MTDPDPHNYICYVCLKDGVSVSSLKSMITFVKKQNPSISHIEIKQIDELDKKTYNHKVVSFFVYCSAQEYVAFKHFLSKNMKKYIFGKIEATQKEIEKYAEN